MKLLTFQAKRFWWRSFSKTLDAVEDVEVEEEVRDAVVAFYQIEAGDAENRASVFRQALKHIKWLANKREMTNVVLHSFTHLGGENAEPDFAASWSRSWPSACARPDIRFGLPPLAISTSGI